jgi:uncharacterized protein YbjT (DUF2867 family)
MRTAIVAGAGGLIGSFLVAHLQNSPEYSEIILLLRKPLGINHPKLIERIVDFKTLPAIKFNHSITSLFCCVGTTISKAGSKENFLESDFHVPVLLAEWGKKSGIENMIIVSSIDANKDSGNFYLQTKGKMQEAITQIGLKTTWFAQPSLLTGPRKEFRLGEKIAILTSVFWQWMLWGKLKKYRPIEASIVAKALMLLSLKKETGVHFVLSDALQKEGA